MNKPPVSLRPSADWAQIWVLVNLVLAVFLFGCVEPWSRAVLSVSWFALAAAVLAFRPGLIPVPPAALGAFALAGIGWLQSRYPASAGTPASGFTTVAGWATARETLLWAAYGAAAWAVARTTTGRGSLRRAVWALYLAGVAFAALGLAQTGQGNRFMYWIREVPAGFTAFGPYYYKNHAGGFLAIGICLGLGLVASRAAAFGGKRSIGALANFWSSQAVLIAAVVLMGVGSFVSRSRGAFNALLGGLGVAGLVAVFLFARPRTRKYWVTALALGALGYVTLLINFPYLVSMDEHGVVGSGLGRVEIWEDTVGMLRARPFWGYGLGGFADAFRMYQTHMIGYLVVHAHGEWLELLVTAGVPGLVLFAGGVLGQLGVAIAAWRKWTDPEVRWLIAALVAASAAFALHGFVEHNFQAPASMAVFMAILVLPCPPRSAEREKTGWGIRAVSYGFALVLLWGAVAAARAGIGWELARRADSAERQGRVALYERALGFDRGNPEYARAVAVGNLWLGSEAGSGRTAYAARALAAADQGLALTPDHAGLLEAKGTAVWWLGDRKAGEALINRARSIRPSLPPKKPARPRGNK
jgi:O-antigen ligase